MANDSSGPWFVSGLVLGGVIGVLAGLILAPRPGEDTLAQLKEKTTELRGRAEELAVEARERLRGAVEQGRTVASRRHDRHEGVSPEGPYSDAQEEPFS